MFFHRIADLCRNRSSPVDGDESTGTGDAWFCPKVEVDDRAIDEISLEICLLIKFQILINV